MWLHIEISFYLLFQWNAVGNLLEASKKRRKEFERSKNKIVFHFPTLNVWTNKMCGI